MKEQGPKQDLQIIAQISEVVTTVYRDGPRGPVLYTTVVNKHFNTPSGNGDFFQVPVEDEKLDVKLIEEDTERQKSIINNFARVPLKTRVIGYVLTASGVYGAKEFIHNSFTRHSLVGFGLLGFVGVGITEAVTGVRRRDSYVQVGFYQETYNAQQFHIRRLKSKNLAPESTAGAE